MNAVARDRVQRKWFMPVSTTSRTAKNISSAYRP